MNEQTELPPRDHNQPPEVLPMPSLPGEATPEQIARAQKDAEDKTGTAVIIPDGIILIGAGNEYEKGLIAYDPDTHAELAAHVQVFCDAAGKWLDIKTIQTAEQSERLTDFVTGARGLCKRVEDSRKGAKKPWDDLSRQVQDAYSPLASKVKIIAEKMKLMQSDWLKREQARIAAEKREAEAKAREAREAAEKAAAEAEARNDISGQVEAEEALKAAQKAEKAAAKPAKAQAGSATGAGRTMALRTVRTAEIVNVKAALLYWMNDPALLAELQRIANAAVRSGDITEDQAILAGIKIKTEKV